MTIIASCGHEVRDIDDLFDLQLKEYHRDNTPCITYGVYCESCAIQKEEDGCVIHNKKEECDWLEMPHDAILSKSSLHERAIAFSENKDIPAELASFASDVRKYLEISSDFMLISIKIDTCNEFTLSIGDSAVTGIGKVQFVSISDAILALNSARITWVRPLKIYTPDGLYQVSEEDTDNYLFFIRFCHDAALALNDGEKEFHKTDGTYSLSVSIEYK